MDNNLVVIEKKARVGIIYLNDPSRRNPLTNAMVTKLIEAIESLDADEEIGAIVLTGTGNSFSAGGDLQNFSQLANARAVDLLEEGNLSIKLFNIAKHTTKPLIAAVNGYALGGGLGLIAMCDIAIASNKAKMGTTEIKIGGFPLVIMPLLIRVLGKRKTLELALTGDIISATEALQIGLVSQVIEHENLLEQVLEMASDIASYSPFALKLCKKAFYDICDMPVEDALPYMASLRVTTFLSEDLHEGASAFIDKRQPVWKGR